jgi:SPP1 gp7 family putative phage head morphogenesis protein
MPLPAPDDTLKAIAWFLAKRSLKKAAWKMLTDRAKQESFTVAGVSALRVLTFVKEELGKAVGQGTSLHDFKYTVVDQLLKQWKGSVANPGARIETVFRTNIQKAYSVGRRARMLDPEELEDRPLWHYDAILDGRETDVCRACDGTCLPADHEWWETHTPPLHFNCRSLVRSKREGQMAVTAVPGKEADPEDSSFGLPSEWKPDLSKEDPELVKKVGLAPKEDS